MTKARLIRAARNFLTSPEGAGLDAATAEQAVSELQALPDWVFNLRKLELEIDRKVRTEMKVATKLAAQLEKVLSSAQQLQRLVSIDEGGLSRRSAMAAAQVHAINEFLREIKGQYKSRDAHGQRKMAPRSIAYAVRGALKRAGVSDRLAVQVTRKGLLALDLTDGEVETALKASRNSLIASGI